MASARQLLQGGSLVFVPGQGWQLDLQIKSKFQWNEGKLKRALGKATHDALMHAGSDVREATRKRMFNKAPRKNPVQWKIATRQGYDLIARINQVPSPDRVTSWKTQRFPNGYLRSQIQTDYDSGRKSVVIGPEAGGRSPRVNYLLELGGTATYYFVPGGKQRRSGNKVFGTLANRPPRIPKTNIRQAGLYRFTRTIRGRHFMEQGLQKALPKIPPAFRGRLQIM